MQHQKIWGKILIQALSLQFKTIRKLPDLTGDSKSIKVIKGDCNIYFFLTMWHPLLNPDRESKRITISKKRLHCFFPKQTAYNCKELKLSFFFRKCRSQSSLDDPHTSAFSLLGASGESRWASFYRFWWKPMMKMLQKYLGLCTKYLPFLQSVSTKGSMLAKVWTALCRVNK